MSEFMLDIDDMIGNPHSNTEFNFMMENSEFSLDADAMTEFPQPSLDTGLMMENPGFNFDADVASGNTQSIVKNAGNGFDVGASDKAEACQFSSNTNVMWEDRPSTNVMTGMTQFDIDMMENAEFNTGAFSMPSDSLPALENKFMLDDPLSNLDINAMSENNPFDFGTDFVWETSQADISPEVPMNGSNPTRDANASMSKRSAVNQVIRGKMFRNVVKYCTVDTLLALRLVDKRMYLAINNHVISTGLKMSDESFARELTKSPRWKRSFRGITLHYLSREERTQNLAKMLVNFAQNHAGFKPTSMSQAEIEARMVVGWRINIYLRNIYRSETRRLRNESNADATIDQPDGMENMKHLALSRFVQDVAAENCFDSLLTVMYFEIFLRSSVHYFDCDWKSASAADRRRLVWAFIHSGANFMEDIVHEMGDRMDVNRISGETQSLAENHFISRFKSMNAELLTVRETHAEELLNSMKVRICGLEDQKFKETLGAFHTFSSPRGNLNPVEISLVDSDDSLDNFMSL